MKVKIEHQPSYAVAAVTLDGSEKIIAETGSMVSMSAGVSVDTKMQGGILKSLGRAVLGGESFFLNTFEAGSKGGEIVLAPTLPGDVFSVALDTSSAYLVQSGSFLASSEGVDTSTKWGGAKTFFSGEGLIMLQCSGSGTLILSSYGAIHEKNLVAGEHYTVDTGHLVAFEESMRYNVRMVGGLKSTILGGEGLVVDMEGPGKILMQTRSVRAYLNWLLPRIPKQNNDKGLKINL